MKDASTPVLAGLTATILAGLAVPGLPAMLPGEPAALAATFVAIGAAWAAVVVPSLAQARPVRVLETVLVLAPALLFALRAAPGPLSVPWPTLLAAGMIGALGSSLGPAARARVAAIAAAGLVSLPILAAAQVATPATGAVLSLVPLAITDAADAGPAADPRDLLPRAWSEPDPVRTLRVGALARLPPGTSPRASPSAGARWIPVPDGAFAAHPAASTLVRVLGALAAPTRVGETTVVTAPWRGELPLDLDPYDAILVPGDAGDDAESAEALADFARRGGLLVRVGSVSAWPEALARRLGRAGALDDAGVDAARSLGAGHVAWVRAPGEASALLAAGLARPRASTAFDRALAAPRAPADFEREGPILRAHRPAAGLLAGVAAVMAIAAAFSRGLARLVVLGALAGLGALEVVRLVPPDAGPRLHAFCLEVGGPGGRRVEGVHVAAGSGGWSGLPGSRPDRRAGLRVLGFRTIDTTSGPRLALAAGGEGWVVEESVASGLTEGLVGVGRVPEWAVPLLRRGGGAPEDFRVYAGQRPYEGPCPPGLSCPTTARAVVLLSAR